MILGTKEVGAGLARLSTVEINRAAAQAIKKVQAEAKRLCPSGSGELRQSIYTSTEWAPGYAKAICYTNKEYAGYVEFGTGPRGEAHHEGISPEVNPVYKQQGWLIPARAMSKGEAEKYGLGIVRNKKGEIIGYATNGQPARPYLYPALKNQEDAVTEIFADAVRRKL